MQELLLTIFILVVLVTIVAIPVVIINKLIDFRFKRKEKLFNEIHPDYIDFVEKHNKLQQESLDIWNFTMPDCKREVDYCLEEMKYYPKYSETYQYYEAKLDVARMKIDKCKEEYDKKQCEILQLVEENKDIMESIKEDNRKLYNHWVHKYRLK